MDTSSAMLEFFRFKEIHDLYLRGQVEEARHQLSELQARYVNLCDENTMLRTQIQGYEDILYLSRA
jgi:cell division protein FtsB